MKTPIAKLTIAAAVIVAALLGIHFSGGTSTTAWAAVLEKVNGFDTFVFRTRQVETTGPRPDGFEFATEKESKIYRSETYGSFTENYENGDLADLTYCLLREKQNLTFSPRDKTCRRSALEEEGIREFEYYDPKRIVAKILGADYIEIGRDIIDDKPVTGVELRGPNVLADEEHPMPPLDDFSARFWIETQTQLPVWVEMSIVLKGSATRMTMIWDQFQWGVPLEASLFKPEIPADYEVVDHTDHDRSFMDSAPKTDAEKAFADNTMAEPYLGDFDHLPLPDVSGLALLGIDPNVPKPQVRLLGETEVRLAHDACVAKWPRYEQVQAQLHQELQEKLGIDAMNVNQLVTTGIALRNRFWELGGCLSDIAYPYAYAARLLDEIAHERAPENSAVIDQLIESIMAYEVLYYWEDPAPDQPKRNPIYAGLLADLRNQQFALLKAKMSQGHVPTWKDFVRCCDLITLSRARKDDATALEAIRLLIDRAETAGWTYYLDRLKRDEQSLAAGEGYRAPVTFMGGLGDVYLDQYGRRLWSFQGPQEFRQSRLPTHLRHLKGW
jgi:outer membrane lipoprotein-sorting protein